MFINDDLAMNHENHVTKVTEVRLFNKFAKAKCCWIEKIIRHLFGQPVEMKYLFDCVLKVEKNIFRKNDSVSIKNHNMLVTNVDKFGNTIWCTSAEWSDKSFEQYDFSLENIIKKG